MSSKRVNKSKTDSKKADTSPSKRRNAVLEFEKNGEKYKVKLTSEISDELNLMIGDFKPITEFIINFPHKMTNINILKIHKFGPRIGFMNVDVYFESESNVKSESFIFLRGHAVSILVILQFKNENSKIISTDKKQRSDLEKYVVLTEQTRVPIGQSRYLELPAGMVDNSGDFIGVAAKELEEETGLKINKKDLICLSEKCGNKDNSLVYPSPGGCDEGINFYLCVKNISQEQREKMLKSTYGEYEEGEEIKLKFYKLEDCLNLPENINDGKFLTSMYMYEKYINEFKKKQAELEKSFGLEGLI